MSSASRPARWKILLAFFIIYFVWGSTYLGIRVGVREVPPFLLAAIRFSFAGLVLYGWMRLKGTHFPNSERVEGCASPGNTDVSRRLRFTVLGRATRALRYRRGHPSQHPAIHYTP